MLDLVRTAFRFSWSLSLFGAQQFVNLLSPGKAAHCTAPGWMRSVRAWGRRRFGRLRRQHIAISRSFMHSTAMAGASMRWNVTLPITR